MAAMAVTVVAAAMPTAFTAAEVAITAVDATAVEVATTDAVAAVVPELG